jgi:hypothetical protein
MEATATTAMEATATSGMASATTVSAAARTSKGVPRCRQYQYRGNRNDPTSDDRKARAHGGVSP